MKSAKSAKRNSDDLLQFEEAALSTGWLRCVAEMVEGIIRRCELVTEHTEGAAKQLRRLAMKAPNRTNEVRQFKAALEEISEFRNVLDNADFDDIGRLNMPVYELAHKLWKLHRSVTLLNGTDFNVEKFPRPRSTSCDEYILD